jgi:1-acyl-sn-glycerol-3-phosphate acyltransferase
VERLTERSFNALRLIGEPARLPAALPAVLIGNHSTWWDGFFVYLLNKRFFHKTLYVMMLEEQLARYHFFRRLGAFGIRQGHSRSVVEALSYSAVLLKDAGSLLCMFPQGELTPYRKRPVLYRRGLEKIVRMHANPVTLLPLAMRCEHLGERLPEAFFLMGRPRELAAESFPGVKALADEQAELMDSLDRAISSGEEGMVFLGAGRERSATILAGGKS